MTLDDYLDHYLNVHDILIFFSFALICILGTSILIVIWSKLRSLGGTPRQNAIKYYDKAHNYLERFYEMVFSASSILSFLSIYYLINRFVTEGEFRVFWDKYSDFILLFMICFSCIINNYFDKMLIPLKKVSPTQKASVRLMGMFYILFIFAYIKYIYENDGYDSFIVYFVGLVIGRFVYFDASFKDFWNSFSDALHNFPLLVLGLACTGLMCLFGFGNGYLLKSNGVLVSTFIAHLFLIAAIFIIHHTHILNLIIPNPRRKKKKVARNSEVEVDEFEDYSEYDNYEE